jgi:hypothetical protein
VIVLRSAPVLAPVRATAAALAMLVAVLAG